MSAGARVRLELAAGEWREIGGARPAVSLAELLAAHGVPLNTRCGGRGLCRGCEVELRAGTVMTATGPVTAPATLKACQARVAGDATIHVPARARIDHRPHVGETFEISVPYAHEPLFAPEPGGRDTAFAVDIGTTTVVVLLVDLVTGEILARAGGFNEQIRFGDNVVTRIEAARRPETLAAMQRAIAAETIGPLLRRACERSGRTSHRIAGGAIAGNTTMLHLLTGTDPSPLGRAPFTPRFLAGRQMSAGELKLAPGELPADVPVQLLPGIAGYVGADITAGIYATGMAFAPRPNLLVDIGTNGEIVLQSGGGLTACATAAGPAFEGCGLQCGTRARAGAVSDLCLQRQPFALRAETIGGGPLAQAGGLCGSAYVDFLATARQCGLLETTGRFNAAAWADLPAAYRLAEGGARALRLAADGGAAALRISEADVARLLQAKAAIGAGIEVLLAAAGLRAADVDQLHLAGGFGMHLNVAHAIAIGLLPGFRPDQVRVAGNTSLAGALLALVDRNTLAEMEKLRETTRVVELNLADGFEDRYIEHLLLP